MMFVYTFSFTTYDKTTRLKENSDWILEGFKLYERPGCITRG